MHALVIDDSRVLRRLLGDMLRQFGFKVDEATNGREGLTCLTTAAKPDIVLVDWNMPEMNGLEFLQAVRADKRFQDLPVMMVTSETESQQIAKALEVGASDYVMKPFSKEVIGDKLQILGLL